MALLEEGAHTETVGQAAPVDPQSWVDRSLVEPSVEQDRQPARPPRHPHTHLPLQLLSLADRQRGIEQLLLLCAQHRVRFCHCTSQRVQENILLIPAEWARVGRLSPVPGPGRLLATSPTALRKHFILWISTLRSPSKS